MGMKVTAELEARCLELAGLKPAKRPKVVKTCQSVPGTATGRVAVTVVIPGLAVVSRPNRREHWGKARRRSKAERAAVADAVAAAGLDDLLGTLPTPLRVTMTRVHGGGAMDTDNLAAAFKACRDELALLIGIDDGSDLYDWRYAQERGPVGTRIFIEGGGHGRGE